jgi:GNAT superfamily N-acetyltransferase
MTGNTTLTWTHEQRPVWDTDKQRIIGSAEPGIFTVNYEPGASLPGDWWSVLDATSTVVGFGWMDVGWGEAEILLAVAPGARSHGVGSFVLDNLEHEAATRGLNYVYNTVAVTHPARDEVHDWLGVRGYRGGSEDTALRKLVGPADTAPAARVTPQPTRVDLTGDIGPGREDEGGYVEVEQQKY